MNPTSPTASTPRCRTATRRRSAATSSSSRSCRWSSLAQTLLAFYVQQRLVIRWRVWLNDRIVDDWLDGRAYHRGRFTKDPVDNPDQRIQQDVASFIGVLAVARHRRDQLDGVAGVVHADPVAAVGAAHARSGVEIPRAMTFAAYLYVIVATVIAFRIGRPLIRLNFLQRGTHRLLPLRARAAARQLRERRVLPRARTSSAAPGHAVPRGDRQRLGHRLPQPEVPGLQRHHHAVLADHPVGHAGAAVLRGPDHASATSSRRRAPSARCRARCRSSASPTTTSRRYRAMLIRLDGLLDADAEARALPSGRSSRRATGSRCAASPCGCPTTGR